ncbi:MAG: type III-B CRISPR module RAMP protein Cmr6 [Anaerolineaceae bacterium]|nr:type III-B CRISPR module RAMP protein Cmr6 [Anaerolineaceae bacterium]
MDSRRRILDGAGIQPTTHPGLWLDKYLAEQESQGGEAKQESQGRKNPKAGHFKQAAGQAVPEDYGAFFARWRSALEASGAVAREACAQGRLILGLGGESVLDASITIHRTYGVPYIPGSALKGLAARFARNSLQEGWAKGAEAYTTLFGDTSEAGYVTFFDALYIPGSAAQDRPLALDVITVHHRNYYRGENEPPADWDSPIPVPFVSATGSYLVALHGPQPWAEAALAILKLALEKEGIGAKTSSGYGRMMLAMPGQPAPGEEAEEPSPALAEVEAFLKRLEAVSQSQVAPRIAHFVENWRSLEAPPAARVRVAQAILDKVRQSMRPKRYSTKAWYNELVAALEEAPDEGGEGQ